MLQDCYLSEKALHISSFPTSGHHYDDMESIPNETDPFEPIAGVTSDEVASHVRLPANGALPTIFLGIAPARSGSTVQLRIFALTGMQAHFQPLKAILRRLMHDEEGNFTIPPGQHLFIKETIGPYTGTESRFDPLQVLLKAGYPSEKILIIAEMREPLSTLTSWQEKFSPFRDKEILFQNFTAAYKTVLDTQDRARSLGISTHSYVYEVQRDNDPGVAIQHLFSRLGLPYTALAVRGWQNLPPFGTSASNIYFPSEPALYSGADFHDIARNSTQLDYFAKSPTAIDYQITLEQVNTLVSAGIPEMYEELRRAAMRELGLHVKKSREIEEFKSRRR